MKKTLLFVYRFNYLNRVLPCYKEVGKVPTEFLYGLSDIDEEKFGVKYVNAFQGERQGWHRLFWLCEKPFAVLARLGLPLEIVPLFWRTVRHADIIFCVNDPISLAVLFWKRLGFISGDVYVIVQSAHERCKKQFRLRPITRRFVGWLLRGASVVYVLADCAKKPTVEYFGVKPDRVHTFIFGVDTFFWQPEKVERGNFVLSIGNDMKRDYATLIEALPEASSLKLVTVKSLDFADKNVETFSNLANEEVRALYQQAEVVVIPSVAVNYESTGLSCVLQAAACEAPLIIADVPPMREVFKENEHCLFYIPENVESLRQKIKYALSHPEEMRQMGERARSHVVANRTPAHAAKCLENDL